ncbi:MAG: hypothetical protein QOK05_696 [Chloroflexota bacterium]|jgi:dihydrofolate reductase|nr:hypothetical protein [Chloroflexota bacterium]
MGILTYGAITSLDGYVADTEGNFDWAAPDEEVHAFVNDLERPVGTYLYGRRMYEVMKYWETAPTEGTEVDADYARIWQVADKVVYSRTLESVGARTRLEREFDVDAVREMKAQGDISIGGPGLAAAAFRAGLVDQVHLFLTPVSVGRGNAALPADVRVDLELVDERRFEGGVVYVRYRTKT